ncbi:GAF and ANTAR domain-containing protein [Streptomyces daliensis]|uniref:GAF and ANTAR domain-containing protein n=1 Tax=Streptomyces daliensis TaxID=299421 RepID=A0A8T4IM17_9ACTN|nr:GAF and ANTAR domain-containing protein [Streptomyces daliensis]
MNREQLLADTFVELADTLVDDFDIIDFLQQLCTRCEQLLDATAAVLIAPPGEPLQPVAPCDSETELSDLFAAAAYEGPALECYRTMAPLALIDLEACDTQWPEFTALARRAGRAYASAVPLRVRGEALGCLLLLRISEPVPEDAVLLGQALADAAAIGLVHEQTLRAHRTTAVQLRTVLHSRVTVEQAKGVLAVRLDTSVNAAFDAMRAHARRHHRRLTQVAQEVIDKELVPDEAV